MDDKNLNLSHFEAACTRDALQEYLESHGGAMEPMEEKRLNALLAKIDRLLELWK
jgi:hypothetical protein